MDTKDWIGPSDEDGLPYFTQQAWKSFFSSMTSQPGSYMNLDDYFAAREQLWAIREKLG
jgi:hypothetical protein